MAKMMVETKKNEFRCGRCLESIGPDVVRVDNKECSCTYMHPRVEIKPAHMSDFISLADFQDLLKNGRLGNGN